MLCCLVGLRGCACPFLLSGARSVSGFQDDGQSFRRPLSWRKKFRPKEVRGLAAGSTEMLPANLRITSSKSWPCMQPKKGQMDGKS